MKAGYLLVAILLTSIPSPSAAAERRVALVIGNAAYKNASTLKNSGNDAQLMASSLERLGFELIGGKALVNAERPAMEQAIRSFGKSLRDGAVGLFFYSGHGLQIGGTNYMYPVSAKITNDADVKYELVDMGFVLDEMANAGNRLNIVILDACRTNPQSLGKVRAVGNGLAVMTAPSGTVIAFATQPGNVASDGVGRNSPYTDALAKVIQTPGLDLFATFNEVGLKVKQATNGKQQPWLTSSPIEGQLFFAGVNASGIQGPTVVKPSHSDKVNAEPQSNNSQADDLDLEKIRACREEGNANNEAASRLDEELLRLRSEWNRIQTMKQRIDNTVAAINANPQYSQPYLNFMANNEIQEYNSAMSEASAARDRYNADKADLGERVERYNRTYQRRWKAYLVKEECNGDHDWFCNRFR